MLATGKNPFYEALNAGKIKKAYIRKKDKIIDLLTQKGIPFEALDQDDHKKQFGKDAMGYAFDFDIDYTDLHALMNDSAYNRLICILDHIQDPHNFGAIIRAGHCFGIKFFIFSKDNQSPISQTVVKTSSGAVAYSKFIEVTNIARAINELKEIGYWVYAADINGEIDIRKLTVNTPSAIIIGSEGYGIRTNVLKKADVTFQIPMAGKIDSLNASQSAAICFYEFSKKLV